MTAQEAIAKIRAEIERQEAIVYGYALRREDYRHLGAIMAYDDLLSFLDTLESEKPMNQDGLEEEINRYYSDNFYELPPFSIIDELARHFAKWGAEHLATSGKTISVKPGDEVTINGHKIVYDKDKGYVTIVKSEESVPNDLEEAAKKFVGYDMDCDELRDYEIGIASFIAGAKWGEEHLKK